MDENRDHEVRPGTRPGTRPSITGAHGPAGWTILRTVGTANLPHASISVQRSCRSDGNHVPSANI